MQLVMVLCVFASREVLHVSLSRNNGCPHNDFIFLDICTCKGYLTIVSPKFNANTEKHRTIFMRTNENEIDLRYDNAYYYITKFFPKQRFTFDAITRVKATPIDH